MKIQTFLYHDIINSENQPSGFQRRSAMPYKHSLKEFKDNIKIITNCDVNITDINNLYKYNKSIMLTFDDGGVSSMKIVEILNEYNIKGHFFISTKYIGSPNFLTKKQILEIHKQGHIIGSHSHSHPNVFKALSKKQMLIEWQTSKKILEEILKTELISCSIPGGDSSITAYETAREAGFKYLFDSEPRLKLRNSSELIIIGRVCPKKGTNLSQIKKYTNFEGMFLLRIIREIKIFIKTILFPIYLKKHSAGKL